MSSIFSKIIAREIPARIVFEDDRCIAFHDVQPQAPVHVLVVPKKEIARVAATDLSDESLLGHLIRVAQMVAKAEGLHDTGFRLVINNGPDGGEACRISTSMCSVGGKWNGLRLASGRSNSIPPPHIVSHNICCMKSKEA